MQHEPGPCSVCCYPKPATFETLTGWESIRMGESESSGVSVSSPLLAAVCVSCLSPCQHVSPLTEQSHSTLLHTFYRFTCSFSLAEFRMKPQTVAFKVIQWYLYEGLSATGPRHSEAYCPSLLGIDREYRLLLYSVLVHMYATFQKFGIGKIYHVYLCLLKLDLFDQKYCKSRKIISNCYYSYYNLK